MPNTADSSRFSIAIDRFSGIAKAVVSVGVLVVRAWDWISAYFYSVKRYSYSKNPRRQNQSFKDDQHEFSRPSIDYVASFYGIANYSSGVDRHARDQWLHGAQLVPLNHDRSP